MLEQGVIQELAHQETADCYWSPVHIVLEQRWYATENKMVEKSRATFDLREINKHIPDSAYPLPLMEHFRRKVAQKNYKIFSNFDLSSMFHQFPIDRETARKNFCVSAMGRIFIFLRLLMGFKNSPGLAQAFMDKAFQKHDHAHPFLDDLTVASISIAQHLKIDLPRAFAIASFYGLLFSPKKTALFAPSCRILGHQISEESMSLSAEKIDMIEK